jgi:hypothetical protein
MLHIPTRLLCRKINKTIIWHRIRYRRLVVGRWPNQREIPVVTIGAVILWGDR